MKKYSLIPVFIFLLVFMYSCKTNTPDNKVEKENTCIITPELKKLIKTDTLVIGNINTEQELTGSVSYDEDHIFRYQSLASGVVQKVLFNIGDYVEKGQVLLEVRTTELSGQSSELKRAEADLKLAQRKLKAVKNLNEDGVASDKDLIEATNEEAAVKLEIKRIRETLTIQGGDVEKGLLIIRSPMSGYIVEKKITTGTQIDAGQDDLFVLSDLKKVWVMANVYPAQLDLIKKGQSVDIQTTAYPDKIFTGKITRLSNIFDAEERVLKAIIEIDNQDLRLKPSMMVSVTVYNPSEQQAMRIPKAGVIFSDNNSYVLVYKNDCDVKVAQLKPVGSDSKFYYVNSDENIHINDVIITQNQLLIYTKIKEM